MISKFSHEYVNAVPICSLLAIDDVVLQELLFGDGFLHQVFEGLVEVAVVFLLCNLESAFALWVWD
jgi:hypothetical protein